jgi:hypothetical protein
MMSAPSSGSGPREVPAYTGAPDPKPTFPNPTDLLKIGLARGDREPSSRHGSLCCLVSGGLAAILVDLARPLLGGVYQALGGTLAELGAINDLDEHRGPVFARLRAKRAI